MISKSKTQTQKIAAKLAKKIIIEGTARTARIVVLIGDLGAGKTAFTQGFIKSLGVKTHIPSPTFVIYRRYHLKNQKLNVKDQKFSNIYHFDLYRVQKPKEIMDLDFKKIIKNPENIVLIEWPEKILKYLPKSAIKVFLSHSKKEKERIIKIV